MLLLSANGVCLVFLSRRSNAFKNRFNLIHVRYFWLRSLWDTKFWGGFLWFRRGFSKRKSYIVFQNSGIVDRMIDSMQLLLSFVRHEVTLSRLPWISLRDLGFWKCSFSSLDLLWNDVLSVLNEWDVIIELKIRVQIRS